MKKFIIFLFAFAVIITIVSFLSWRDEKLMDIDYCWDSNGAHYVMPDERCIH